jgi:hypothetical protein
VDKLIATQQRCHGPHIEKLQAAIAILRGERDAPQQSTALIIDPVNSRYGIIDCNIGIIDFSSLRENHEYAALAVLQCAKDLLEFYGEMKSIDIRQHQPNNDITPGI